MFVWRIHDRLDKDIQLEFRIVKYWHARFEDELQMNIREES